MTEILLRSIGDNLSVILGQVDWDLLKIYPFNNTSPAYRLVIKKKFSEEEQNKLVYTLSKAGFRIR